MKKSDYLLYWVSGL